MVMCRLSCLVGLVFIFRLGKGAAQGNCTDFKKQTIVQGQRFIPLGYDPCTTCTCENGEAAMCNSVLCSPPKDCLNSQLADDKCCEFMCKNGDVDHHTTANSTNIETKEINTFNTTNLGLRLVASTVTSFLILALLLFMIHRLRQRRLLLMIRRFNNNLNSAPCSNQRYPMRENGSVGYYPHHDHVAFGYFEDPPPPYSLWKPPESYFSQEAPPPYEIALNSNHIISPVSHPLSPGLSLNYELPLPSLSNVSLHTNNFQINDLDREISENNQTSTVLLHSLNVTGSMSSLHENNANIEIDQDVMAIRSDATYEECPFYKNQENCNSKSSLNESSGNEVVSNLLINDASQASSSNKYHSCSDVVDCWQRNKQDVEISEQMKRHSLQSTFSKKCKVTHCFPDPTSWIGDVSESSSSSSPTYEQRTLSPTSSDSSSIDYNLPSDSGHSRLIPSARQKSPKYHLCSSTPASSNDTNENEVRSGQHSLLPMSRKKKTATKNKSKGHEPNLGETNSKLVHLQKELNSDGLFDLSSGATNVDSEMVRSACSKRIPCIQTDKIVRVPRISYVSDGEDNTNLDSKFTKKDNIPCTKIRPKSYDFGNLCVTQNLEGTSGNASGLQYEKKAGPSLQSSCLCHLSSGHKDTSCSFDSLTCSSQASFGSTSSSSYRDEQASPSTSKMLQDGLMAPSTSETVNDNGLAHMDRLHDPGSGNNSAFSVSASGSSDLSHSRSASVCSETGERKHQGPSLESRDTDAVADLFRVQMPRTLRNSHQIRMNVRTYKQNQESYI